MPARFGTSKRAEAKKFSVLQGGDAMKRVVAVALIAMLLLPGAAWAGSSTDAALGLGAFAALGTILLGAAALSHAAVAPPVPVAVEPPPAVVYAPPPPQVVYQPAPPPVVYAPS